MKFGETLSVRVAEIEAITLLVKRFTLVSNAGENLPGFSAGSHVVVYVPGKDRIYRNAYSLISAPRTRDYYQIGVLRQEQSRGGSVYMHEQVKVGDLLQITPPVNLFPLERLARKHILIAGGIGITPFFELPQRSGRNTNSLRTSLHLPDQGPSGISGTVDIATGQYLAYL